VSFTQALPSTPSTAEPEFVTYGDCVPLHVLAEYMRDGTWLDVMTGEGFLQRVRIVQVIVGRRREQIAFRQQWLEGNQHDTWLCKQRIVVDAWSIWQIGPTRFSVDEVQQWGESPRAAEPEKKAPIELGDELSQMVAEGVIQAAVLRYNTTVEDLKDIAYQRQTSQRYVAMLVMFEMTDLTPVQITAQFGYRSQMPLVCARDRLRWYQRDPSGHQNEHVRPQSMRELAKITDKLFRPERYRTSRNFPRDYKPVL